MEAGDVEPSDEMTAAGYDEAVESGAPFSADSSLVDAAALTEADPVAADEIVLQEPGRDLRPDTITPAPDLGATEIPSLDNVESIAAEIMASDEEIAAENAEADAAISPTPAVTEDAASSGSTDEEKH